MEETEATDELNIACSVVNHFAVDEDINTEMQHSRRKVVPIWFWERYEDEENFPHKRNQLLQSVNPYFWKEIASFPTLSALVPSQMCPLHKQDAGILFSSRIPGRRAHRAVGGRHTSTCAAAFHSLCFSSGCISYTISPCL